MALILMLASIHHYLSQKCLLLLGVLLPIVGLNGYIKGTALFLLLV